jgi:hypothetical protein
MKRIEVNIDQPNCKISGFQDKNQLVLVLVNQGESFEADLPELKKHKKIDSYITSEIMNLAYQPVNSGKIQVPKQSIVTLVYHIK